jgi:glyoxylase-like metal-dependent hydrolase (beta-lactamase superfamily II)
LKVILTYFLSRDRDVREISFSDSSLRIGKLPAYDFFGDGSFYLLDTPGHAIGHMCGLVRTTPTTFAFLGGDICHFYGMCRPSPGLTLPDPIPSDQLDDFFPSPCPCSTFTDIHPSAEGNSTKARTTPFFNVTSITPSSYHDRETAIQSIRGMQDFDASPDVLVCIAHDPTLLKVLPVLNDQPDKDLNDWKSKGFKDQLLWGWLNDLPRSGKPGRPMLIDGAWRNGEKVPDFVKLAPSV